MPRSPAYGVRTTTAALGVLRAQRRAAAAFPAGMVARWTLDDTGGLTDLIGGLALTPSGTVGSATGVIGEARSFGGAGSLAATLAPAFDLAIGFAVEVWIYPTSASYGVLLTRDSGSAPNRMYLFDYLADQQVRSFHFNSTGSSSASASTGAGSVPINTWTHVAFVVTASRTIRVYLNGSLAATSGATTDLSAAAVLPRVAANIAGTGGFFTGRLDELAIYQFPDGDPGAAYWLWRCNNGAGRRP